MESIRAASLEEVYRRALTFFSIASYARWTGLGERQYSKQGGPQFTQRFSSLYIMHIICT